MKPEYCLRCGLPHDGDCLRTVPERLDAAENGDQLGRVLNSLFTALEHAIDEEDQLPSACDAKPSPRRTSARGT